MSIAHASAFCQVVSFLALARIPFQVTLGGWFSNQLLPSVI